MDGNCGMAMGREGDRQGDLIVTWSEMPRSPGHVFYDRLQEVLIPAVLTFLSRRRASPITRRSWGHRHCRKARGVPPALTEFRKSDPLVGGRGSNTDQLRGGADLIHLVDLLETEGYRAGASIGSPGMSSVVHEPPLSSHCEKRSELTRCHHDLSTGGSSLRRGASHALAELRGVDGERALAAGRSLQGQQRPTVS